MKDKKRDYSLKSPGTKPSTSLNSSSSYNPHRSSTTFLNSLKNQGHHHHDHPHHPRSSHAPSVTNQGASLDESLEGDSPTDSGSPISSTHYSSGEDIGESKDIMDDRSLIVPSSNFVHQSFGYYRILFYCIFNNNYYNKNLEDNAEEQF